MEDFVLIRDVPASVGWLLAAKWLPLHKDCVQIILKYLFRKVIFYDQIRVPRQWNQNQLQAYNALYTDFHVTTLRMGRNSGKKTAIAGIAANLLLTRSNYKICILTATKRSAIRLIELIDGMMDQRMMYVRKNSECIQCANKSVVSVLGMTRDAYYVDLVLCYGPERQYQQFYALNPLVRMIVLTD